MITTPIQNYSTIFSSNILCQTPFLNLRDIQRIKLHRLVDYSKKNSRFYKNKFKNLSKNLYRTEDIPISTKYELMSNFSDWLTDDSLSLKSIQTYLKDLSMIGKPYLRKYLFLESSGSSGIPGIFIHDLHCFQIYQTLEATRRAHSSLLNQYIRCLNLDERIAYIGATKGHYAGTASIRYAQQCFPILNRMIKEISIYENIPKMALILNDYLPTVVATYPSVALSLAEDGINNGLLIFPKEIWVGGETLDNPQKNYIESRFHTKVFNSYGASEFPSIAWECDVGRLHVNADWLLLEAVDEDYQHVADGETSYTCLLTNFCNYVQPIIRYDLGDSIRYDIDRCLCGNHLPTIQISGRKSNHLIFQTTTGDLLKIPTINLSTLLEEHGFFNFSFTQDKNRNIEIAFKSSKYLQDKYLKIIHEIITIYLKINNFNTVDITIKKLNSDDPKNLSGKLNSLNNKK